MKHQILRRTLSALMAGVLCISCMCGLLLQRVKRLCRKVQRA